MDEYGWLLSMDKFEWVWISIDAYEWGDKD